MLPIKKIYIDSKHRTPDSLSSSHFKYDLPESFLMPDNCGLQLQRRTVSKKACRTPPQRHT